MGEGGTASASRPQPGTAAQASPQLQASSSPGGSTATQPAAREPQDELTKNTPYAVITKQRRSRRRHLHTGASLIAPRQADTSCAADAANVTSDRAEAPSAGSVSQDALARVTDSQTEHALGGQHKATPQHEAVSSDAVIVDSHSVRPAMHVTSNLVAVLVEEGGYTAPNASAAKPVDAVSTRQRKKRIERRPGPSAFPQLPHELALHLQSTSIHTSTHLSSPPSPVHTPFAQASDTVQRTPAQTEQLADAMQQRLWQLQMAEVRAEEQGRTGQCHLTQHGGYMQRGSQERLPRRRTTRSMLRGSDTQTGGTHSSSLHLPISFSVLLTHGQSVALAHVTVLNGHR